MNHGFPPAPSKEIALELLRLSSELFVLDIRDPSLFYYYAIPAEISEEAARKLREARQRIVELYGGSSVECPYTAFCKALEIAIRSAEERIAEGERLARGEAPALSAFQVGKL